MQEHPIFIKHRLPFLSEATGYSVAYLRDLRSGRAPLTDKAKAVISHKLGEPESVLFDIREPVGASNAG